MIKKTSLYSFLFTIFITLIFLSYSYIRSKPYDETGIIRHKFYKMIINTDNNYSFWVSDSSTIAHLETIDFSYVKIYYDVPIPEIPYFTRRRVTHFMGNTETILKIHLNNKTKIVGGGRYEYEGKTQVYKKTNIT